MVRGSQSGIIVVRGSSLSIYSSLQSDRHGTSGYKIMVTRRDGSWS